MYYYDPYPTSLYDLFYEEQLKRQKALYYQRLLRQQQEEQERKRRLLAYYQQQEEYNKKRRLSSPYRSFYRQQNEPCLDTFLHYINRKPQSLDINVSDAEEEEVTSDSDSEEQDIENRTRESDEEEPASDSEQEDSNSESQASEAEEIEDESQASEDEDEQMANEEDVFEQESVNQSNVSESEEEDIVETDSEEEVMSEAKANKLELLKKIRHELETIREENEHVILETTLDFSQSDDERVTATTFENRQFLGYEDQIMKVLLKLDMIESDGDQDIRLERKSLVKLAESMLDTLDAFRHQEWERALSEEEL